MFITVSKVGKTFSGQDKFEATSYDDFADYMEYYNDFAGVAYALQDDSQSGGQITRIEAAQLDIWVAQYNREQRNG